MFHKTFALILICKLKIMENGMYANQNTIPKQKKF